jgi:hypothetical protein
MRTLVLAILSALLLVPVEHRLARADGISVKKQLSLAELVKTSDAIFTATLLENDARWGSVEVRGENQRFVQEYHFRFKVTGWLKGKRVVPEKGAPWLSLPGEYVPGTWTVVEERLLTCKAGASSCRTAAPCCGRTRWRPRRACLRSRPLWFPRHGPHRCRK